MKTSLENRLKKLTKAFVLGASIFVSSNLFGCSGLENNKGTVIFRSSEKELNRTWDNALVSINYGIIAIEHILNILQKGKAFDEIPKGIKLPTIIYLHGCNGMKSGTGGQITYLSGIGYAVIAPDSFAREYRPNACFSNSTSESLSDEVVYMREEEIKYAAEQLRKLDWVDQKNVFLIGQSEGGMAVAAYPKGEFKARIVIGTVCSKGIWAPANTPILNINSKEDPVLTFNGGSDNCGRQGYKNLKMMLIPGSSHDVIVYPEAREEISDFLKRNITK